MLGLVISVLVSGMFEIKNVKETDHKNPQSQNPRKKMIVANAHRPGVLFCLDLGVRFASRVQGLSFRAYGLGFIL